LIVRLIANEMMLAVLGGLLAGVATGYVCGRYVQGQLYGLHAHDPLVFSLTIGTLVLAAVLATLVPAMRASRIDPSVALRYE
jgi:putative ABC transport system permease protein